MRNTKKIKEGSLALILFNIDDFKLYNQLYGNQQGDVALRKVADIIQASVGEQGYVARHSAKEICGPDAKLRYFFPPEIWQNPYRSRSCICATILQTTS